MDLAKSVSCTQTYGWDETEWAWPDGTGRQTDPKHHVVAVDYGAKRNILRCLASAGCRVTVVPATATAEDILRHQPDGVFLSNGPGDPAATGAYAVPAIRGVLEAGVPLFGICLGHQLLGARARREDLQARSRPSRREPAGEGSRDRQGRDHQPESRLRGGRQDRCRTASRSRMSRCSTARTRGSPAPPPGLLGAVPSGGEPRARPTAIICSAASSI